MIGKEALIIFETYEKQQSRIYTDATDFGLIATPQKYK